MELNIDEALALVDRATFTGKVQTWNDRSENPNVSYIEHRLSLSDTISSLSLAITPKAKGDYQLWAAVGVKVLARLLSHPCFIMKRFSADETCIRKVPFQHMGQINNIQVFFDTRVSGDAAKIGVAEKFATLVVTGTDPAFTEPAEEPSSVQAPQ